MAGLRNRKRQFVRTVDPIADGFAAVGDASVCTNPLYGRGCSLALVHAFGLADALREHGDDLRAGLLAFAEVHRVGAQALGFRAAVLQDEESRMRSPRPRLRAPTSPPAPSDPTTIRARGARHHARRTTHALQTSPVVFRAFLRWFNLLARPDALIADGEVISEVMAAYAARDSRPPPPAFGPTRDELLATLKVSLPLVGVTRRHYRFSLGRVGAIRDRQRGPPRKSYQRRLRPSECSVGRHAQSSRMLAFVAEQGVEKLAVHPANRPVACRTPTLVRNVASQLALGVVYLGARESHCHWGVDFAEHQDWHTKGLEGAIGSRLIAARNGSAGAGAIGGRARQRSGTVYERLGYVVCGQSFASWEASEDRLAFLLSDKG